MVDYHRHIDKWTFEPDFYQNKGILFYQPARDIAHVTWNGYKSRGNDGLCTK